MPPRYATPATGFADRVRNEMDAQGRPARAGLDRLGGRRGERGGQQSAVEQPFPEAAAAGAAKLLVLSATGDSIASGGDHVAFDTVVAQVGFGDVVPPSGGSWVHPITGVYLAVYTHEWDTFTGGGHIELEVDGVVPPEGVIITGSEGQRGSGTIAYYAVAGAVGKVKVTSGSAAAQTCDATLSVAITDPAAGQRGDWVLIETVWLETLNVLTVTSTSVLVDGRDYRFLIDGNYDPYAAAGGYVSGAPDAVMYPSTVASNEAARDADTDYALGSAGAPQHNTLFTIDLGSGAVHREPVGGPYSAPTPEHLYEYLVTGEGSAVTFSNGDSPLDDNNGRFRIRIYEAPPA